MNRYFLQSAVSWQWKIDGSLQSPIIEPEEFFRNFRFYKPVPLISLRGLAAQLGLEELWLKNEAERFGTGAFKVLGASFALFNFLYKERKDRTQSALYYLRNECWKEQPAITFSAATDGNHGRAVAWAARYFGQKAEIFIPANSALQRIRRLKELKANVHLTEGSYDQALQACRSHSKEHGWQVVADTAYENYFQFPFWIMLAYTQIFAEIDEQLRLIGEPWPEMIIVQCGVGGLAGAAALYLQKKNNRPLLGLVQPESAPSFLLSVEKGQLTPAPTIPHSQMAGLNCATPSLLCYPIIVNSYRLFLSIEDRFAEEAVRWLYFANQTDQSIAAGESGAAGLAGLLAMFELEEWEELRALLKKEKIRRILLINTEEVTDQQNFRRIIGRL